jgi:hypothetical protein
MDLEAREVVAAISSTDDLHTERLTSAVPFYTVIPTEPHSVVD